MWRYISQRMQMTRAYADGIAKGAVIYPAAFSMAFTIGLVGLGLVFFARDVHGASPAAVGWLTGAWALPYVAGCLLVRPRFARVPARYQIVLSLACNAILIGLLLVAPGIGMLFALQAAFGLSLSLFWPPLMSWMSAGSEGAELGRLASRFSMSWCGGVILGPYAAGLLTRVDARLPLVVGALLMMIMVVFVAGAVAVLPGVQRASASDADGDAGETAANEETMLRFPAWIGHLAIYLGLGVLVGVFPVGARTQLGYSEPLIGSLFLMRGLANTITFGVLGRTSRWHFRLTPMVAAPLLGAAVFLTLSTARSPWIVALCMFAFGIANGHAYTVSLFHGASGARDRAHRMAIHESIIGFGLFAGPSVGGMIYQAWSLPAVYACFAGLMLAAAALQIILSGVLRRAGQHRAF
jgi:predicted MFS family arabinose efflux permease